MATLEGVAVVEESSSERGVNSSSLRSPSEPELENTSFSVAATGLVEFSCERRKNVKIKNY